MLNVPSPVSPEHLKCILELAGYKVATSDKWNWVMVRDSGLPITLPRDGEFVAVEVMMDALDKADMLLGTYLPLKQEAAKQLGIQAN